MLNKPSISVVVPVYNSEPILPKLVSRLHPMLDSLADHYELVLVNDGSHDHSWDVIARLADEHNWIHGIDLMRNYGQHNALLIGIRAVQYDVIVTMDDDLQHPPEEIPRLLGELDEGFDVVYGTPQQEQHGLWRDLASKFTKLALQSTMGAEVAQKMSAFRAFRTKVRDGFTDYRGAFPSVDVLLTWGTTRFSAVPVRHDTRLVGKSNYTFRKLVVHAFNMITGFSTLPLRLASLIGFIFTIFGVGILVFVVGRYLIQGKSVPGFPFLASIISIFSGAMLFALGIIGEYLARMYERILERPMYIIKSTTDKNTDSKENNPKKTNR